MTVIPSNRSLMASLPVIGWFLVALAALLCGGLVAARMAARSGSWTAGAVPVVVAAIFAAVILLLSRYTTLRRLRPRFIVDGTVLTDDRGGEYDLMEMDGIQTWIVEHGETEPAPLYFALIPRGETARVDPQPLTGGTYGRYHYSAPPELAAYAFCYQSQLRPRLHVFAAELQRRAPHLFIDHVGVM